MTLPDCMMPDGADPCRGYAELKAENERLQRELAVAEAFHKVAVKERDYERQVNERLRDDAKLKITQHKVADAFWRAWKVNGEAHKHGYYESTWIALQAAIDAARKPLLKTSVIPPPDPQMEAIERGTSIRTDAAIDAARKP